VCVCAIGGSPALSDLGCTGPATSPGEHICWKQADETDMHTFRRKRTQSTGSTWRRPPRPLTNTDRIPRPLPNSFLEACRVSAREFFYVNVIAQRRQARGTAGAGPGRYFAVEHSRFAFRGPISAAMPSAVAPPLSGARAKARLAGAAHNASEPARRSMMPGKRVPGATGREGEKHASEYPLGPRLAACGPWTRTLWAGQAGSAGGGALGKRTDGGSRERNSTGSLRECGRLASGAEVTATADAREPCLAASDSSPSANNPSRAAFRPIYVHKGVQMARRAPRRAGQAQMGLQCFAVSSAAYRQPNQIVKCSSYLQER